VLIALVSLAWSAEVQLELDDAVRRAWENHAGAVSQRARIDALDAAVRPQRAPEDPQLRVRVKNIGSQINDSQYTLRLRQELEPVGAIRSRVQAARAAAQTETADLQAMHAAFRVDVAVLFDAVRYLGAAEDLLTEEVAACDSWIEVAQMRREAQVGDADDVIEAEFAKLGALRRQVEAHRERVLAESELRAMVGLSTDDTLLLVGPDLLELATGGHGGESSGVVRARARLAEEQARRKALAAKRRPFIDWVQAQAVFEPATATQFGMSVAARLPVFSLGDGAMQAADARVSARQATVDAELSRSQAREAAEATAIEVSSASVLALRTEVERLSALIERDRDQIRPDRLWEIVVDLLRERQDLLELAHEASLIRRKSDRGVMLAP